MSSRTSPDGSAKVMKCGVPVPLTLHIFMVVVNPFSISFVVFSVSDLSSSSYNFIIHFIYLNQPDIPTGTILFPYPYPHQSVQDDSKNS